MNIIARARVLRVYIISFRKIYKMSQANSAARKRRAGGASFEPQNPQQAPRAGQGPSQGQGPATGLTLPQVIAVVDARLIKLETFMKETQTQGKTQAQQVKQTLVQQVTQEPVDMSEFDQKFEVLANEIADLKDIVLKLQSYTMDVNKMLMEERINVLSDMGETEMTITNEQETEPASAKKEVTFNLSNDGN